MNPSDDQDFGRPGDVQRDPLTEGWKPIKGDDDDDE
jgi:hypothetical protein